MSEPVKLMRPDGGVSHAHMRLDLNRGTRLFVTRNVNGHIHVTIGNCVSGSNTEATLILHPHAAERLIADIQTVLTGEDFAHD